jgi:hypothetical protein
MNRPTNVISAAKAHEQRKTCCAEVTVAGAEALDIGWREKTMVHGASPC